MLGTNIQEKVASGRSDMYIREREITLMQNSVGGRQPL